MKFKKIIIATLTFSFLALNMSVISANADEAEVEIEEVSENDSVSENIEEDVTENISSEEVSSEEDSESNIDENTLEAEKVEVVEDTREVEEEDDEHPCSVTITTLTTMDMCTPDHEIVSTETEIRKLNLESEEGLTISEVSDLIFAGYEDDELLSNEKKAFRELDLPEQCPENLEIKFYVNNEDGSLDKVEVL